MNIRSPAGMDKHAFFAWLGQQDRRFELVDGWPRMLPFVTSNHARICANIFALLITALDRDVVDVTASDFAIETGDQTVRFADIMVYPFMHDPAARSTHRAALLVEVLSNSTAHIDFGDKLSEYAALAGVDAYVICAQDRPCVWLWQRGDNGDWPIDPLILDHAHAVARLTKLDVALPLAEIYKRVPIADQGAS
jgi:Uma2 family endonuclease